MVSFVPLMLIALLASPVAAGAAKPVNAGFISVAAVGGHSGPASTLPAGDYVSATVETDTLTGPASPDHVVARIRTMVYWDGDTTGVALPNRYVYRGRGPVQIPLDPFIVPGSATSLRMTFALDRWDRKVGWHGVDTMDTGTVTVPGGRPWAAFAPGVTPVAILSVADTD
jgi:hypothetical protein